MISLPSGLLVFSWFAAATISFKKDECVQTLSMAVGVHVNVCMCVCVRVRARTRARVGVF